MHNPIDESLARYVKGTAHNIAYRRDCPGDVEDVEQDLILALLELYTEDPDAFALPLKDLVARIANKVDWEYQKAQIHAKRNLPAIEPAGQNPWPEIELTVVIRQALASLDPRDRQIAAGLAWGYSVREIASDVGCCFRTVYNRMHGSLAQALGTDGRSSVSGW